MVLDALSLVLVGLLLRAGGRTRRVASFRARLGVSAPAGTARSNGGRRRRLDGAAAARAGLGTGGLVAAIGLVGRSPVAVVLGLALTAASALLRWAGRLGAGRRVDRALAPVVEQLGRQLRGGASLPAALAAVAVDAPDELAGDLRTLSTALGEGDTMHDVLRAWRAGRPRPSVALVTAALGIGHAQGGLRAQSVEELAVWLREADEAQREAVAQASQAQASAAVMVVAPVGFAALLAAGDAAARHFLLHSTAGAACVAIALALDLGAAAMMVRAVAGFGEDGP